MSPGSCSATKKTRVFPRGYSKKYKCLIIPCPDNGIIRHLTKPEEAVDAWYVTLQIL